ncbi:MAG: ribulokinase [Bacteroidetes bacterium GWF2_42_66]|nr:MAG: ribulokinase [Bacteroidetes bacterium GWA2_42_15]OFY03210.1 MAG: ribulokinase [Bacteroidetes bacterium GWE2_42_39]OFY43410.1 MAG: ribulokinase [Bacteroidetes bacterium GWF2_42_66]HBL77532.1 ribulokinase [Prolixibacteraceae bacterium]HCR89880.1 ribulokinase [Prolixibacteraceae bacterium]
MTQAKYTIGLDYGSDSVRSLIVNVQTGEEVAGAVFEYPRWKKGMYCNPAKNRFRQHPKDYLEGLEYTITQALKKAPAGVAENVVGISVDTTGSTPVAVDEKGTPLSLTPGFEENPNAMFVLWKDHTALKEADEINELAKKWEIDFTKYEGGIYSSEWFWAKLLHVTREDPAVYRAAYSWVEHCDWIPALLTGDTNPKTLKRSRCAAGHKAMWHEAFDGLPSEEFLTALDPVLSGMRDRLFKKTYTCDVAAGKLSKEWAGKLGLSADVVVGVGAFDAHLGAVGSEIKPYYISKVMGTSTCDMLIAPMDEVGEKLVPGICGQVDGSIVPGMLGMEAGQSAFGDIYAWFKKVMMWPAEQILAKTSLVDETQREQLLAEMSDKMIAELSKAASEILISESGVLAIDWMNGRRTPDANQNLKGAIAGLSLGTDAPRIFRALVESTAFGSKAIIDRFVSEGVRIDGVIALGGVAKKSPLVMQIVCDVLNMPIKVARSEQACALGSAMAAAVVAGIYATTAEAQQKMGGGIELEYYPIPENVEKYKLIYEKYKKLGNFIETKLT